MQSNTTILKALAIASLPGSKRCGIHSQLYRFSSNTPRIKRSQQRLNLIIIWAGNTCGRISIGLGSSSYTKDHYKNILALHIHFFLQVSGSGNAYHLPYGQQWDYMGFQPPVYSKNIHRKVSGAVPFKWRGQEERQKPSSTIFPCTYTQTAF